MKVGPIYKSSVASSTPYDDNVQSPLSGSDNVQGALDYLKDTLANSASPGFTYGRSGSLPPNTWLLNDTVPSNKAGRINYLNSCFIKKVFISQENAEAVKIGIYSHDGNENNLTLISTILTPASRTNYFDIDAPVSINKQIAIKIEEDSPNSAKNIDVGLMLKGFL